MVTFCVSFNLSVSNAAKLMPHYSEQMHKFVNLAIKEYVVSDFDSYRDVSLHNFDVFQWTYITKLPYYDTIVVEGCKSSWLTLYCELDLRSQFEMRMMWILAFWEKYLFAGLILAIDI